MGAVDLLSADTNGLSDPYVKVRLPSYHPYRYLVITPCRTPTSRCGCPRRAAASTRKRPR